MRLQKREALPLLPVAVVVQAVHVLVDADLVALFVQSIPSRLVDRSIVSCLGMVDST